jgi:hypothetical protein
MVAWFVGGCFAAVALLFLRVDALPPCLGLLHRKPLLGCFYGRHNGRSRVVSRVVALSLYLFCFYVYFRLLTTILVVCNLCYEGSLIVDL